jgi:hypothetical protein
MVFCCLHLHGTNLQDGDTEFLENVGTFHQTTWCHIPKDFNLHIYCHENLKSHRIPTAFRCRSVQTVMAHIFHCISMVMSHLQQMIHVHMVRSQSFDPILGHLSPVHTIKPYVSEIHFIIIS